MGAKGGGKRDCCQQSQSTGKGTIILTVPRSSQPSAPSNRSQVTAQSQATQALVANLRHPVSGKGPGGLFRGSVQEMHRCGMLAWGAEPGTRQGLEELSSCLLRGDLRCQGHPDTMTLTSRSLVP